MSIASLSENSSVVSLHRFFDRDPRYGGIDISLLQRNPVLPLDMKRMGLQDRLGWY
jgi:hypothetical protein